jgi:hypothetical protein
MHKHEHFDLVMHDDGELAAHLGSAVVGRKTLHEWPLSCVQRLALADGRRLIYKSQSAPPSVEAAFYRAAGSPMLVEAEVIHEADGHVCMLLECIHGPRAETAGLAEEEAVRLGRELLAQIAELEGPLPCFLDVGTEDKWRAVMARTFELVRGFVADGTYTVADEAAVRELERAAECEAVLASFADDTGLIHSDMTADNVFVLPDGSLKLIDWQYPRCGPRDVDLAALLESLSIDTLPHVGPGPLLVRWLLQVEWVVQCTGRWIPYCAATYDRQIAELAESVARLGM